MRPQYATQVLLTPGDGLGIGREGALAQVKFGRVNLIATTDTPRGDDMVEEFVIDDELDKICRYKGLIKGGMDANRLGIGQIGAKANRAWPGSAAPASPTNPDLCAIREIALAQLGKNGLEVMITTTARSGWHGRRAICPENALGASRERPAHLPNGLLFAWRLLGRRLRRPTRWPDRR